MLEVVEDQRCRASEGDRNPVKRFRRGGGPQETQGSGARRSASRGPGHSFHETEHGRSRIPPKKRQKPAAYGEVSGSAEAGSRGSRRIATVQISARQLAAGTIIDVAGDIDLAHSPAMRKALLGEIKEKKTPKVFLNLRNVRYIDSSGIASLVEGLKASRDIGSRLILFALNPAVREVMELSRLQKIFEIYDSEEQALAA